MRSSNNDALVGSIFTCIEPIRITDYDLKRGDIFIIIDVSHCDHLDYVTILVNGTTISHIHAERSDGMLSSVWQIFIKRLE